MYNEDSNKDIKSFVLDWNKRCPIDRWWREKYKVPFNSSIHRATSPIDMYIDFCEEKIFSSRKSSSEKEEDIYIKGEGNFLKERVLTEEEIDKIYNEIDVDNME